MATNTEKAAVVATVAAAAATAATMASKVGSLNAGPPVGITDAVAARFLTQATFGPNDAAITELKSLGFSNWINAQIAMPYEPQYAIIRNRNSDDIQGILGSFWMRAITKPDQLRQRMQFALSQIFVISRANDAIGGGAGGGTAVIHYYDQFSKFAFGNWRDLLQFVVMSPLTGIYLTYAANDKEDPATGRTPDENFARELMQLYALGTVKLKQDGTPELGADGKPIPSYTSAEIKGLAKVFTGLSWHNPGYDTRRPQDFFTVPSSQFFSDPQTKNNPVPMQLYPDHHSKSEKRFLGVTIPATAGTMTSAIMSAEIQLALDTVFNHQNTAPYFAKRLIQQFVTSNPTPGYVSRVAAAFIDNGQGVRGDMGATIRAVLMDTEARDTTSAYANPNFGKIREPILRLTAWGRAFKARSNSGQFNIHRTFDPGDLGQEVMHAPSVFNFWRAGYVPPGTGNNLDANLVAPELQIVSEHTTASYANYMRRGINAAFGRPLNGGGVNTDVLSDYTDEIAIAQDANLLVDRMNKLLFCGRMTIPLRDKLREAANSVPIPGSGSTTTARTNRVKIVVLLSLVSAEFLAQR